MYGPSNSSYARKGSDGVPLPEIDHIVDIANSYEEIIADVMEEIREEQEQRLREMAARNEGWNGFSESLHVTIDPDVGFNYYIDDDGTYMNKEYGDLHSAPSPLIRPFMLRQAKEIPMAFENKVRERF